MNRIRYTLIYLAVLLGMLAACFGKTASAQTVNLFNPAASQTGGPYVTSDTSGTPANSYSSYAYEVVNLQGFASVVPNIPVGANGGGNTSFVIPFFDGTGKLLSSIASVGAGQCITVPNGAVSMGFSWNSGYAAASAVMLNDGCTSASSYISFVPPPATVTFSLIGNQQYTAAPFQLGATSNSGGAITYSLAAGYANPATVSSTGLVTLTGQNGTVGIIASVAATTNYAAGLAGQTFQVVGAPVQVAPAISLGTIPNKLYNSAPFSVSANTNSTAPLVLSIASGPATISGSTVTLTGGNGTVVLEASTASAIGWLAGTQTESFIVYGAPVTGPQAGYTTVTGTYTGGVANPISNATISFTPVAQNGTPISFRAGGAGGPVMSQPVTAQVTDGIFSVLLPDTSLTYPLNVGYAVQVIDNLSGNALLGPGYGLIQPSGATWSLDSYNPNLPGLALVQPGPAGPAGPQGPAGVAGTNGTNGAPGVNGALTQTGTTGGLFVNGALNVNEANRASVGSALRYAGTDPQGQGRTEVACILNLSDSIDNGVGETEAADRPLHQLEADLVKSGLPMAGSGLNTILGYSGTGTMDWQVTGTIGTSHEFGPYQTTGTAVDSIVAVASGNAVTLTLSSPTELHYGGTTLNLLAVTDPGDTGIDVFVDNTKVGSAACAATSSTTAPAICKVTYGGLANTDHTVVLRNTNNGPMHVFGVEWTGVSPNGFMVENYGHGTTRSDSIASDTAHQLAFIPYLSCTADAVLYEHGDNNVLQSVGTQASLTSDAEATYAAMEPYAPNASWFVLDAAYMNPGVVGNGLSEQGMHDGLLAFAQSIGAGYFSLKDAGQSYAHQNGLGWNSGDNIHPSDKLGRFIGWEFFHWMNQ